MAKITVRDIPKNRKISKMEMKQIMGGEYWTVIDKVAEKIGSTPDMSLYRSKAEAGQSILNWISNEELRRIWGGLSPLPEPPDRRLYSWYSLKKYSWKG